MVPIASPASLLLQFTASSSRTPRCLWSPVLTMLLYAFLPSPIHHLPRMHVSPVLAWLTLCILQVSAQHHLFQEMLPEAPGWAKGPSWVFSQELVCIYSLLLLGYIDIIWLHICLPYKTYILAPRALPSRTLRAQLTSPELS